MKLVSFIQQGTPGVGFLENGCVRGRLSSDSAYPGDLDDLIRQGNSGWANAFGNSALPSFGVETIQYRPPFTRSNKIICVGLNYRDHTVESGYKQPEYPTLFARFTTSLVAHQALVIRPRASQALDFEGELVAVIGKGGRHIAAADALSHVAGYSIFNDASIRDFQHRTPQWTVGKNFDGTGAFGPVFVTADELPAGGRGLRLETRLNGEVMQSASTDQLIFDVATLVSTISEAMTLMPGDLIVTGTPSGIGHSRSPKVYMKPGDLIEVEIEGIGVLRNRIADEE
jgi:2-keto-4-pentenoate hydratase/2-oxohepta-3-ene-1,7-dioic acid hydratase in catechol pathway